jgi:glycosyl transferase family 2
MFRATEAETISLNKEGASLVFTYPSYYYDSGKLAEAIRHVEANLSTRLNENADGSMMLEIYGPEDCLDTMVTELFSRVNGYPYFQCGELASFRSSDRPLLSCIILLTANDIFVRKHLIPSIIQNSRNVEIEIVVVYNGAPANPVEFGNVRVCTSEFAAVARGYNTGVKSAKGEYVAIFHDDCVLNDPCWIRRCIGLLNRGATLVSPEIRSVRLAEGSPPFIVAKNVPLVLRREDYWRLGGYDEAYVTGWEDLDFTCQALSQGAVVQQVKINCLHCNGMSTVILLGGNPTLFKALFGNNMLPPTVIRNLRAECLKRLLAQHRIKLIASQGILYFADKFDDYLRVLGCQASVTTYHQKVVSTDPANPVLHNRKFLLEAYRDAMNAANFHSAQPS